MARAMLFTFLFWFLVRPWQCCALSWHEPLLKGVKVPQTEAEAIGKNAAAAVQKEYTPKQRLDTGCEPCPGKYFSEPCPLGWSPMSDGTCQASSDYGGICSTRQSFAEGSAVEKEEVELVCGVCWPCACERDFSQPCPSGYAQIGNATCSAEIGYDGPCEQLVSFRDVSEKKAFAQRCKTTWACK